MALEREIKTFERVLPTLSAHDGQYVLIAGEEVLGTFDSYGDALQAGYKERGLEPFLVKRISPVAAVGNFTRAIRFECTAPTP